MTPNGQLFRVKVIKSEDDLPKEKGEYYFFHSRGEPMLRLLLYCAKNDNIELLPKCYVDGYDFWLEPIDLTDADIEAWAGIKWDKVILPSISDYYRGLIEGAKAMKDGEIKHIDK
jgi:hypothetical protein